MFIFIRKISISKSIACILIISFLNLNVKAQLPITLSENHPEISISSSYSFLIDSNHNLETTQVIKHKFSVASGNNPVFEVGVNKIWIRFSVYNHSDEDKCYLNLKYTNLSKITLYKLIGNSLVKLQSQGNSLALAKVENPTPNFVFLLNTPVGNTQPFFLEVESIHPIILPAYISTNKKLAKVNIKFTAIVALYCGIIGTMFIYNFFLFVSVKDKNYLIYSIYTFTLLLAQLTATGYMYKYVWYNYINLNNYSVIWTTNFSFIAATFYSYNFLQVKKYLPQIRWIFGLIIGVCIVDMFLALFRFTNISYVILNYITIVSCILVLIVTIAIAQKGFSPAYLYLIAWSSLFISLILLALRNLDVIPYNDITASVIYIGSAIETILLSFALANKINIYKKEKEESQAQALKVSKENEKLIQEQNVSLEKQVAQRTYDLEKTLRDLKDAQVQLVESEKMASLGQLTAGIAHEINNPINFVKSNVSPLLMDVKDLFELITEYQKLHGAGDGQLPASLQQIRSLENRLDPDFLKEEIENLIGGIEEGAERTAEIVRGLRNFSRLDESEMKEVNIYDNINSTLILLRNATPYYLKIRKHFEARGDIECYPGKLNQVFMNILTNCIHAVKAKAEKNEEEYIDIVVTEAEEYMRIEISDTGVGMTDEVKHKIFDPFFTTKDVGEGTGLGMSIVFKIIEKHHGKISVHSIPGEGAAFTIEIPYMLKTVSELAAEETAMADEELETE